MRSQFKKRVGYVAICAATCPTGIYELDQPIQLAHHQLKDILLLRRRKRALRILVETSPKQKLAMVA